MNEPLAVAWLEAVKRTGKACGVRLAPYEAAAANGTLKTSDVTPIDAVWILGLVKDAPNRDVLKVIAKGVGAPFVS